MNTQMAKSIVENIAGIAEAAAVIQDNIAWENAESAAHNTKILEKRKADLLELLKNI